MDKVAKSNDPHEAQLDKDERTPEGLHKVRRQIRSAAWRRGINIRIRTVKGMIFVQAVEEEG